MHQDFHNLLSTTVFNIDNNIMLMKQQITILEWFLKDHATLKSGIMLIIQL